MIMKYDMKKWLQDMLESPRKKAMPVLSFPAIQLMGITVKELISSSELQAKGMKKVADRVPAAASVSLMDLSVEAECFGSAIRFSDDEVPTVIGSIVSDEAGAKALRIPEVGSGRTGIYIQAIEQALQLITDRPVFAGVIGPFSLAGRLMDVTEAMIYCYEEPEMVATLLEKAAAFTIEYCRAYKAVGAHGVVLAEPLAGLLSPELSAEFSCPYVRKIVEAVQDDNFIVIYHNCGGSVIPMIDSILATGASAFHFGNAISMAEMMTHIPPDTLAMGNIDPAGEIRNGTPESVRAATLKIMDACCKYPNFVISTGCDVPPMSPWENIDAFFCAVDEFYTR
jgi:uroporphyrinogen decarboxylase